MTVFDYLKQYFCCPEHYLRCFALNGQLSPKRGYFRFGENCTCFGKLCVGHTASFPGAELHNAQEDLEIRGGTVYLPFDASEVIENLRTEAYGNDGAREGQRSLLRDLYYSVRPLLPVSVRRHLQKVHLRGWERLAFPRWPVDPSVDDLLCQLLLCAIRAKGLSKIPFIWFWPEGASSCAIMTHDVETKLGQRFCSKLMDIDDSFGLKASFQIIPEERYSVTREFLNSIRDRGFEVVVHDLNHDGFLYHDHERFLDRAVKINAYGREYEAKGFRAGVLYRKQLWFDALDFEYDMSVPNVARLDPQRGGCCTVMPYFVGKVLEIPVTTTQDYTLFNILRDYSIDLWKQQIDLIMQKHGLMSFIAHPDYIVPSRERDVYEQLLRYLVDLRTEKGVWITTPGEVNRWWRQRAEMRLVQGKNGWEIEGSGKERARIAWASEQDGQLAVSFQGAPANELHSPVPR